MFVQIYSDWKMLNDRIVASCYYLQVNHIILSSTFPCLQNLMYSIKPLIKTKWFDDWSQIWQQYIICHSKIHKVMYFLHMSLYVMIIIYLCSFYALRVNKTYTGKTFFFIKWHFWRIGWIRDYEKDWPLILLDKLCGVFG